MNSSTAQAKPPIPHLGRRALWGVVVPAAVTAAAITIGLSWLPRLPHEVAVHWGPGGVNRYGTAAELLWPMGSIAVVSVVVLSIVALLTGRVSLIRRMVLGTATGLAVFQSGVLLAPIAAQLDLESREVAVGIERGILLSLAAALAASALAGATAGRDPKTPAIGEVAGAQADLNPGERAVWIRRVSPGTRFPLWATMAAGLYTGLMALIAWSSDMWLILIPALLPLPLLMGIMVWQIRIDSTGLTARSSLGWPRLHIPADEIEGSQARQVERPLGEFGGWGIRTSLTDLSGTVGVIIRKGEALEIVRTGDRRTVITVDDAATGSALLNTTAHRARQAS